MANCTLRDGAGGFRPFRSMSGDFSRSDISCGPEVLPPIFWATTANIILFGSNSVFARVWSGLEAEWMYPSPTQSGESSLRGSCAVPVWLFFWIRGAILSGRRDFNITNNARLSPKLCSTQHVSRKDHSNRSSGGVTLVTSVDPVSCATFQNFFFQARHNNT